MTTATELKTQILTKAAEDEQFRASLIAEPKGAIASETGAVIPEGFKVVVHEDSATAVHLVLPSSSALTEADLKMVAGGGDQWGGGWDSPME